MERINRILSFITSIVTIAALVPVLLVIMGNSFFQDLLQIRTTEVLGIKGYTYYEPVPESYGKHHSWLLANETEEASLQNLKRGDLLQALHNVNIRVKPTTKSRRVSVVPPGGCVLILDASAHNPNDSGGGWLYVGSASCD